MTKSGPIALALMTLAATSAPADQIRGMGVPMATFASSAVEQVLTYAGPQDYQTWEGRVSTLATPQGATGIARAMVRSGNVLAVTSARRTSEPVTETLGPDLWSVRFEVEQSYEAGTDRGTRTLRVSSRIMREGTGFRLVQMNAD